MAQGNFAPRSRTFHRQPASSAPAYTVKRIVDEAYRRLAQPNLAETGGLDRDRLASGILALRGVLDTINANPVLNGPSQFVEYDVPLQPTLTWGLGGWDIDDQPPLQIQSLWVYGGAINESRAELEPMSQHDLANFRLDGALGYSFPTRYFLEQTWPIRTLHLDVNETDNQAGTDRENEVNVVWSGGDAEGPSPVVRLEQENENPRPIALLLDRNIGDRFVVEFDGEGSFEFARSSSDRLIYTATPPEGFTLNARDGTRTIRFFTRLGGPPIPLNRVERATIRLQGFVTKAFAIPEKANTAANYELQMPPGYFEYVLTALAIRLCSLSNKPVHDALLLAHEAARFGIRTQTKPTESRNDLKFLTPRRYRRYRRSINRP